MDDFGTRRLRALAPGILLALLSILLGFGLGGTFGAAEERIKGHLASTADAVFESVYGGDVAKRDAVVGKSWSYFKRAHLHAGSIGTAALSSTLLLALLAVPGFLEKLSSTFLGAGALLYSLFWLFAGLKAPEVGSTGAAKEALQFMAVPGAGLCILGLAGTLVSTFLHLVVRRTDA